MANEEKTVKRPNRQVTRRLEGLANKLCAYGGLQGMELVFVVRNKEKDSIYSYLSSKDIDWLGKIEEMRSQPRARNEFPEHIRQRLERSSKPNPKRGRKKKAKRVKNSDPDAAANSFLVDLPTFPNLNLAILGDHQGKLEKKDARK